jgi:Fe2+ or Zn2+ uptake regulation protein
MPRKTRYSKQREEISLFIKGCHSHPTAKEVYQALKKTTPKLSLGTVYRNLDSLTSSGRIRRIDMLGGADRFDGNMKEHYHLVCRCCLKVIDIELDHDVLGKATNQNGKIKVEKYELVGIGVCRKCQKYCLEP